jgi:adenylosuccinate synthase
VACSVTVCVINWKRRGGKKGEMMGRFEEGINAGHPSQVSLKLHKLSLFPSFFDTHTQKERKRERERVKEEKQENDARHARVQRC